MLGTGIPTLTDRHVPAAKCCHICFDTAVAVLSQTMCCCGCCGECCCCYHICCCGLGWVTQSLGEQSEVQGYWDNDHPPPLRPASSHSSPRHQLSCPGYQLATPKHKAAKNLSSFLCFGFISHSIHQEKSWSFKKCQTVTFIFSWQTWAMHWSSHSVVLTDHGPALSECPHDSCPKYQYEETKCEALLSRVGLEIHKHVKKRETEIWKWPGYIPRNSSHAGSSSHH